MADPRIVRDADALLTFLYDASGGDFETEVELGPFLATVDWNEPHLYRVIDYLEREGLAHSVVTSPEAAEGETFQAPDVFGDETPATGEPPDETRALPRAMVLSETGAARFDAAKGKK